MYRPFSGAQRIEPAAELREMFAWAQTLGVTWPKIVYPVLFPPGYIGSMAIEEIGPGERIVTAPNRSLLTANVAAESELKPIFTENAELFSRPTMVLVTFLIWEKFKGEASVWAPFLKYQPKNPSNLQDWSPEELSELQDSDLITDV
jgi:hypothetical protein